MSPRHQQNEIAVRLKLMLKWALLEAALDTKAIISLLTIAMQPPLSVTREYT